ncbi:MAG: DUF1800 domain-containing protein [Chloroflexota bacterium]
MSGLSRRNFLKLMAMGTVATGCSPIIDGQLQKPLALTAPLARQTTQPNRVAHAIKRLTWGATLPLIDEVAETGVDDWIAQQLDYESIDDNEMILRLRRFDTLTMSAPDLMGFNRDRYDVANELAGATVTRALFSKRQLYEMMVYFWTNHFNIYHFKEMTSNLKTVDDREVIRPHALGNFGDMLRASAHSPAMLLYLDNVLNEKSHPNENYAREIMELHTLGVDGAYTETDVLEVARCFTGWSVDDRGRFQFRSEWHDEDEKIVLGHVIPAGGGKDDGDRVIEILIEHPDTARYISYKLAQRFVADEPSADLVDDLTQEWRDTNGDIQSVMRRLVTHDAFWSAPAKFKVPLEFALSTLRILNTTYNGYAPLIDRLDAMGQRPFGYSTPDGYPDVASEWQGSLTQRWNFVLDTLNDNIDGVSVPIQQWSELVDGVGFDIPEMIWMRPPNQQELTVIRDAVEAISSNQERLRHGLALTLSSPAFQWR